MSPYNGLLLHFMSMGRTCSQFTPRKYTAIAPYVFIKLLHNRERKIRV
ncbi:uncharacterized protein EKO05_0009641 [Ascochyta rabiei]|nr:uncharacterized protein EKO05_0009641 [Ascochyta rabiei]UPX19376.1 hypothetical protein EKO05_0009641 [Ascochyta rabiei]